MATWITQGRFTDKAINGFVTKPEDRREAVAKLMESVGARLVDYWMTFGEFDFLIVAEGDNEVDMMGALLTAASSGSVADMRTVRAFTTAEAKEAMQKANEIRGSFRPAGS